MLQNFEKVRPPSRQLFALSNFELHKQSPTRPLKWPFWPFKSQFFWPLISDKSAVGGPIQK